MISQILFSRIWPHWCQNWDSMCADEINSVINYKGHLQINNSWKLLYWQYVNREVTSLLVKMAADCQTCQQTVVCGWITQGKRSATVILQLHKTTDTLLSTKCQQQNTDHFKCSTQYTTQNVRVVESTVTFRQLNKVYEWIVLYEKWKLIACWAPVSNNWRYSQEHLETVLKQKLQTKITAR